MGMKGDSTCPACGMSIPMTAIHYCPGANYGPVGERNETPERVGTLFRRIRHERGLGLREAAKGAGLSPASLSREETRGEMVGEPGLVKLARFYGLDPDAVLAQDGRVSAAVRAYLRRHPETGTMLAKLAAGDGV